MNRTEMPLTGVARCFQRQVGSHSATRLWKGKTALSRVICLMGASLCMTSPCAAQGKPIITHMYTPDGSIKPVVQTLRKNLPPAPEK